MDPELRWYLRLVVVLLLANLALDAVAANVVGVDLLVAAIVVGAVASLLGIPVVALLGRGRRLDEPASPENDGDDAET